MAFILQLAKYDLSHFPTSVKYSVSAANILIEKAKANKRENTPSFTAANQNTHHGQPLLTAGV
jgi:uncharacterized membrane protein YukC